MSGPSTYDPKTGIERWLDQRLPIVRMMHDSFVDYPTPRNLNYFWTFGAILMLCLVTQIVTGIVLAMHYTPSIDHAFDSVQRLKRDVPFGWLIQNIHATGASMFFLAVYIHMFRGLYYGSYKAPREVLWILGVVIYVLMTATAFLGYVLPWGQMSFWGATVITNFFTAIPIVGEPIQQWLMGGFAIDNPTLNRFFSLHYLLPFVIFGVVILHVWALHVSGQNNPDGIEVKDKADTVPFTPYATIKDVFATVLFMIMFAVFVFFLPDALGHPDNYIPADPLKTPPHIVPEWYLLPFIIVAVVALHVVALHIHGSNNPTGIDPKGPQDTVPFHPYYTMKDGFGVVCFLIVFAGFVFFAPDYLGHPDNYIPANPLVTPAHIVPEWYFLPFYAILRAIPDKLGGVLAMFGAIAVLFVLPWLDTSRVRSCTFRPIYKWFMMFLVVDVIVLGICGSKPPEGFWVPLSQLATLYYFAHFLVLLPILGKIERPLPLPPSIADSVLKKKAV